MNDLDLNGGTINGPEFLFLEVVPSSAGHIGFGAQQPQVVLYRLPIVTPESAHLAFDGGSPEIVLYRMPHVTPGAAHLALSGHQPDAWLDAIATTPGLSPGVDASAWIYLVEVGAVIGDAAGGDESLNGLSINDGAGESVETTTLRFTNSSMGYATRPSEVPGNAPYDNCLQQPGYVQRDLTVGAVPASFGEVILASTGHLDGLLDYGLDGQTIQIRRGPQDGAYPNDFPLRLVATLEQPEIGTTTVRLKMRDRMTLLEQPLQPARYGGSNILPDGIDGGAELQGNPKPLVVGRALNMAPVMVNTSRLIYQAHAGLLADLPAVYDRGAALVRGADYASEADMQASAPAPGQYRAWLAGGYFRLGAAPDGQITCDAVEGASVTDRYAGAILARLAGRMGIAEIDMVDAYTLDIAAPYELGVAADGSESAASVMTRIASGVGAWFGFDRLGYFRMGRLQSPAGTPAVELTEQSLTRVERIAQSDVPVWQVALNYARNLTVQANNVAGAAADRLAWLAQEWRSATASNPAVRLKHPLSGELTRDSAIVSPADASAEAARLLALYSVRRDTFSVGARLSAGEADLLDLGDVVRLTWPRYGLNAGRLFVVTGMKLDFAADAVELTLWG